MRLYIALLVLYPEAFRRRYEAEMRRDFRELMLEELREGGATEMVGVWVRAFSDLVLTALKERGNTATRRYAYLAGQEGNDLLWGGHLRDSTTDVLSGGEGNDVYFVYRELAAKKDIVFCGEGRDQVLADRVDALRPGCERVVVVHGSPEDIERQAAEFHDNRSLQKFFRGIRFPR